MPTTSTNRGKKDDKIRDFDIVEVNGFVNYVTYDTHDKKCREL